MLPACKIGLTVQSVIVSRWQLLQSLVGGEGGGGYLLVCFECGLGSQWVVMLRLGTGCAQYGFQALAAVLSALLEPSFLTPFHK